MGPVSAPIAVHTELGRIVEAVGEILARREKRQRKKWADLSDELEALVLLVRRVNRLYERLLSSIQRTPRRSSRVRDRTIGEIHDFLHNDEIIAMLTQLQGKVQAASQSDTINRRRIRNKKEYRKLSSALRGLERATGSYLDHLRQIQNFEVQTDSAGARLWNLADVANALEADKSEVPLDDLCEEAIRNRRTDLVYAISRLTGEAIQHINMLH